MKAVFTFLLTCAVSMNLLAQSQDFGFGFYEPSLDEVCLSEEHRAEIQRQLEANLDALLAKGKIRKASTETVVKLSWPLRLVDSVNDYGYHGISNFVDHNTQFPNQLLDYNCGRRTYDRGNGYNHSGTDYFLWPFTWHKMDNSEVEIVAAFPGVIILKQDGNFDRSCGFNSSPWNAVYVRHEDGSVAWYGHMKSGSLTSKEVGETVATGEYLGAVGSSGNSTGPHLHFELRNVDNFLIDPYLGNCNEASPESWWAEQRPYYDSGINAMKTHWAPPEFKPCGQQAIINEQTEFKPGESIYLAAYYRDQLSSQVSEYAILKPDGSVYESWSQRSNAEHYSASYWWWRRTLPSDAPDGVWKFVVVYEGQTYEREFSVFSTTVDVEDDAVEIPLSFSLDQNYPNPFNPVTSIRFTLATAGHTRLSVFTLLGQEVAKLVDESMAAGTHVISFDGRNLASGVYVYRLEAGNESQVRKLLLLR